MGILGLLPNTNSIVNDGHQKSGIQWHNFLASVQSVVEYGQPIGQPVAVSVAGIILPQSIRSSTLRVIGDNSPITITANPQISLGFDGQEITIEGSDNTKTLTFTNGNGLQLAQSLPVTLGNGDVLRLHFNAFRNVWIENYRSINN